MRSTQLLLSSALAAVVFVCGQAVGADPFYVSIPGPTLSYAHLYYGQEKGFFAQQGLDLQVLVVRGIVGVSSLMAGEIDVTCHAGSGLAAAVRGLPLKVISVTHDRPVHELIANPAITSAAELKGKAIAVGSLEGTAAVIVRRILQAKGLDSQKDVTLLSMDTTARLQSLLSGKVAGGMVTPPTTYLTVDRGFHVLAPYAPARPVDRLDHREPARRPGSGDARDERRGNERRRQHGIFVS